MAKVTPADMELEADYECEVLRLADLFQKVAGLDIEQGKMCVYFAGATYHLDDFELFPILEIIGPSGTGKSRICYLLSKMCYGATIVSCKGISLPGLRDELTKHRGVTFIAEEADEIDNPTKTEGLFGMRTSPGTSNLTVKRVGEEGRWQQTRINVFGASVVHHRRSFNEQAVQNRAISIRTKFKEGVFSVVPEQVEFCEFSVANPPQISSGRAYDTWRPLLSIASGIGDYDWLNWTKERIEEASDEVRDGQDFEPEALILGKVLELVTCSDKIDISKDKRIHIQNEVVRPLKETLPYANSWLVSRTLKKLGLVVARIGGTNWLYPSTDSLQKAAESIGYVDKVLEKKLL